MTAKRKKATKKKAARKSTVRKKRKTAAKKRQIRDEPANGGFVILLDDPDPSEATETEETTRRVRLRCDCTIEEVGGIRQRLLNSFDGDVPLTIDLGAVDRVDTAFLQLLCSLVREADVRGVALRWEKPSKSFNEASALLGIDQQFRPSQ